ncbi:MAG: TIGR04551 family protein [Deltaproteobacteria bacterium]|nr:TIGR04551 family protein [Deltaproteobacteria bacterium]
MIRSFFCAFSALLLSSAAFAAEEPASKPVDLNAPIVPAPTQLPAATPGSAGAQGSDLPPAEWNAEDWDVQKPQLNLLELDGYFRLRPDLIFNGHLANDVPGINIRRTDTTSAGRDATVAGANMRLRVTPTLNITEDIQLVATFDVFDNVVLGSTANSVNRGGPVVNVLEVGQASPNAGWNALRDVIQVRRVYAKVATPIGELRFGRQPNRWGLGMYANEGDCIDCDHGDNVDRISFVGMLGSYYIVPMIDYMSEGPTTLSNAQPYGQARDLDQLDDATQLSLQVAKKDAPEDVKEMLERGEVVFNWGLWNMFRFQARENPRYFINPTTPFDPNNPDTVITRQARDSFAYVVDGWLKLQYKKFSFELEALFLYAHFLLPSGNDPTSVTSVIPDDLCSDARPPPCMTRNRAYQWGAALDARYDILPELYVRLRAGIASGDDSPGFGIGQDAYNKRGDIRGINDTTINNFQFNRDYRVDLILFRELLGTVSGAWYIKPEVSYTFGNGLGGRFAPIYAQALYGSSTPGGRSPIGFELDFEAFYNPLKNKGFDASIQYGLFLPLDMALRNPTPNAQGLQTPGFAHRVLGRLSVQF